jgi:hypothetical protein
LFVVLPCTETASWSVAPVSNEADAGDTEIEDTATGAAVTVTLADADLVVSATLVAVMVAVPVFAGAVKTPAAEIVPVDAVQVTAVLVTVPWTVALKEWVVLTATLAVEGETVTESTTGAGGGFAGGGSAGGGLFVGATPVAVSWTTVGFSLTLVARARLPVMVPGESGVNATAKVLATPGPRVVGSARPVVLKPLPVTVTWWMVSAPEPVLLAVTVCVALLPTDAVTETEFGVTESCPASGVGDEFAEVLMPPTHPANWNETATRLSMNTRSEPRFGREKFGTDLPYLVDFYFDPSRPRVSRLTNRKEAECGCYGSLGNAYYLYWGQFLDT